MGFLGLFSYDVVSGGSVLKFYCMIDSDSTNKVIMDADFYAQSALMLVKYPKRNAVLHIVTMITISTIEEHLSCHDSCTNCFLKNRSVSDNFQHYRKTFLNLYGPHSPKLASGKYQSKMNSYPVAYCEVIDSCAVYVRRIGIVYFLS